MLYRDDKNGNPISQLGYGCMRFSTKGASIDYDKAEKELLRAINLGVNYLDTAYIYPGSEECLGKVLHNNDLREKVNIATKLPQFRIKTSRQIDTVFHEELKRLQTDYIDFYLLHMMTDYADWERLQSLGIEEWIAARKASGAIRNIGFSYHGNTEMFLKILDAYDWDFCQVQYNYLDEHSQAGRKGVEYAYKKGIPVIIMEPLRGGKLVNLPDRAKKILDQSENHYTAAEIALRWLWDQPGITCVLSGMNSLEMVEENTRIASEAGVEMFTDKDRQVIEDIKAVFREREKVGCTGCRYCMPCPKGVDIPGNFYFYNLMYMENKKSAWLGFGQAIGLREESAFASQCVQCGKCEQHCPQNIPIREKLKEADRALRPLPVKAAMQVARKLLLKH